MAETNALPIVCFGASAGGLEALSEFLDAIPAETGAAYVVVVHLSPDFKSLMPELLAKRTPMPVETATDGMQLEANHVYIIPPGSNMAVQSRRLSLTAQDRGPGHPLNLPVDVFLKSAAEDAREAAVGIILSGTGSDGSRGVRFVREAGGLVLVQAPESAKFDGMPHAARAAVRPDDEGTPTEIARSLLRFLTAEPAPPELEEEDRRAHEADIADIMDSLAIDGPRLDYLRTPMVMRRVRRRILLTQTTNLDVYAQRLRDDIVERSQLRADLLIGVTQFFREPRAIEAIERGALPNLLSKIPAGDPLRIWVPACSTGQEAYTLAMLALETMDAMGIRRELKVFGTDIDKPALERASRGIYTTSEIIDVPPNLLARYFTSQDSKFAVRPQLRRSVIFAQHNVVQHPPFIRMDLVSCRNLLIYLEPGAQKQVLSSLYWALQPGRGVLVLGEAESVGPVRESLPHYDGPGRLFTRGTTPPAGRRLDHHTAEPTAIVQARSSTTATSDAELHRIALETTFEAEGRSAALIDVQATLLHVIADPQELFRLPKGRPTADLARILPNSLVSAVLMALSKLTPANDIVTVSSVNLDQRHEVVLRPMPGTTEFLLTIQVSKSQTEPQEPISIETKDHITALDQELRHTKEALQTTIEELQSANEEQQSTNEELIAANEELQTTNEELHSVNEELFTVNSEFQRHNDELLAATDDLDNLLKHSEVAVLYLDQMLTLRRFSGSVGRIFPIRSGDIGRPITDLSHRVDADLAEFAVQARDGNRPIEHEVRDQAGAWHRLRAYPYESPNGGRGVLITLVDVTRLKNSDAAARAANSELTLANELLREQADQLEDMLRLASERLELPVSRMSTSLERSRDLLEGGPPDAAAELDTARSELQQLEYTLADISRLRRETNTDVAPEPVELAAWLDSVMEPFRERSTDDGARMNWVSEGGVATFPRAAAERILLNLVDNALRHGKPTDDAERARVDVLVQAAESRVRLVVSDNGPGVADVSHDGAFQLLRRSDRDASSPGVGLIAVRRLANRMGGELRVRSQKGKGSRFSVEFPGVTSPADGGFDPNAYLLLVEDDTIDARRVTKSLPKARFDIATSIAAAADRARGASYSLILLDLSLPDGHGLELLERMAGGPNRRTPVIVLSGHDDGLALTGLPPQIVAIHNKDALDDRALRDAVEGHL